MESTWYTKKRSDYKTIQESKDCRFDGSIIQNPNKRSNEPSIFNRKKKQKTNKTKEIAFKTWKFGTINIRSGKERDEGAKIYSICKEISKAGLSICCLQEVKYRNTESKMIRLKTGEEFEFHWCGMKKRREAGVGFLI